ncbi:unnamed protein product [Ectocarpus sp. 12 AP-2014]
MSLFGGLDDGVVESIPTLIDEDLEDLFAGGEDLFELLDERVPPALVIPPAPMIAPAPVVAPSTPAIESREPPGYTAPVFFPFGKPEPTAPQLKLSGVSSFKKINSRLLQGGALSDREEADAIRELERALGVLGHQKRFLREHKAGLEKWASAVYGFNLSSGAFAAGGAIPAAAGDEERQDSRGPMGARRARLREVRVSLKCKGAKRRAERQLVAHVNQKWAPSYDHSKNVKKRSSGRPEVDKPTKRSKPPAPKADLAVVVETSSITSVSEGVIDEPVDKKNDGISDVADRQVWLEDLDYLSPTSGKQPPSQDTTHEAEDRLGRNPVTSPRASEPAVKATFDTGVRGDRVEDDAEILRQRLVRALVVRSVEESVQTSDVRPKPDVTAARRKPASAGALDLLDVTQLNLAQRVLVQLHGVGLIKNLGQATSGNHVSGSRKLIRANAY